MSGQMGTDAGERVVRADDVGFGNAAGDALAVVIEAA